MEKSIHKMELDLGHVEYRESFPFKERFTFTSVDEAERDCIVTVTADVTRTGSQYLLEAEVGCDLKTDCSRCMKRFVYRVNTSFKIVFQCGEKV